MTTTDPYAHLDAAYVFGALDDAERSEFESHLAACPQCRARVAEARSTLDLLGPASRFGADAGLIDPVPMPDTLLPGLLRKTQRERRRRRLYVTGVAGVAAACLVALLIVVWPGSTSTRTPAGTRPRAMAAVGVSHIVATAALRPRAWGTEIDVHCRYEHEQENATFAYGLTVIDRDGHPHAAGTWLLVGNKPIDFVGGTEIRRDRIARVQVTLPDGKPVLELKV